MVASWAESEWDDDQLELIEAERIIRSNTGPNGEWLPDATSDDADPMSYKIRYVTDEHINWAEKQRLDDIEAYRKEQGEGANLNGKFWTVRAVDLRTDDLNGLVDGNG